MRCGAGAGSHSANLLTVSARVKICHVFVRRFVRVLSTGVAVLVMIAGDAPGILAEQNEKATADSKRTVEIVGQGASRGTGDWLERVKKCVAGDELTAALQAVDARLAAVPEASDAMGWRAQILAWTGQRKEAEATYRRALRLSPKDGDFLLGWRRCLWPMDRVGLEGAASPRAGEL